MKRADLLGDSLGSDPQEAGPTIAHSLVEIDQSLDRIVDRLVTLTCDQNPAGALSGDEPMHKGGDEPCFARARRALLQRDRSVACHMPKRSLLTRIEAIGR